MSVARRRLRAATRGSPLALWQAERVRALLGARGVEVDLVLVETTGDRVRDVPIHALGGQGVFVKEVQAAVLDGRADLAVHSAKDLPSVTADGLVLACVPERADPRDVLVGSALAAMARGATVATGSARRRVQLARLRPDLAFVELRGNIATRLDKVPPGGAIVMALAALERLGLAGRVAQVLAPSEMLPQVAQGALAVECRAEDAGTRALLAGVEDGVARACVDAERAFLAELGGGCDLPVGAYAVRTASGATRLEGMVAARDGSVVLRRALEGDDVVLLGRLVARHLLDVDGGRVLLGRS